jgi:hypothetical protein
MRDGGERELVFGLGPVEWRGRCLVRLDERFRKCAVVIGTRVTEDEIDPWGSGFLVVVDVTNPSSKYLVTTWHVIAGKEDAPFDVRFNKRGGGAKNFHIDDPHWITHPTDKKIDVAVHEIDVPEWADCSLVPKVPIILENDRFESKDIGAGNRTYTVGLWRFLHGDRQNQPFVFTGHIGLVPKNQLVSIESWLPEHEESHIEVEAYLVEGEPLDGASGSPVFVRRTLGPFSFSESGKTRGYIEGSEWLLGIQSNAWFGKPDKNYQIRNAVGNPIVPRGVNAVIPSMKINEVLEHPELKDRRKRAKAEQKKSMGPRRTASSRFEEGGPRTSGENPKHREDFNSLLDAAARKRLSGD